MRSHHRHLRRISYLFGAFGNDRFGRYAERLARFFGTPKYILGQTIIVLLWIAFNIVAVAMRFDPYPFILLNLAFSTQAAYAAPLILLAQNRQAERDQGIAEAVADHQEEISARYDEKLTAILEAVTRAPFDNVKVDAPDGTRSHERAGQLPGDPKRASDDQSQQPAGSAGGAVGQQGQSGDEPEQPRGLQQPGEPPAQP